ncbi:hypothetical protein CONCODRAFT_80439 [Conidiobolus coronatus NRRL 28638]|uniref:MPN domain-containing protein n=1 Tax=Conidiobolus coronatus (strain ATCC 28846 / CBS 209.66 / NRRL 28638) TaxID=796925 RepID=A0A137NV50_CONC2|nr:hypothetical protein CONCODRAFT_80439 [Conidiobolus coronatus NRRL 28638]|eukprot:KXN66637.1 hypothetical protein CONCODRAFT_80439 [Conidiobolus coronatus NRRL 28638]
MDQNQTKSQLNLLIHPLPIINIVDHFTRLQVVNNSEVSQILGVLLGTQTGPQVNIASSYELKFEIENDNVNIDWEYFEGRNAQMKQILPDLEHLGWYFIGDAPNELCDNIQKQIQSKIENPLLLLIDIPSMVLGTKEGGKVKNLQNRTNLPLQAFEYSTYGNNELNWLPASKIEIVSDSMESIGIDWSNSKALDSKLSFNNIESKTIAGDSDINSGINYFTSQLNSVELLKSKLSYVLKYLQAIKTGELNSNSYTLKQIKNLIDKLPNIDQLGTVDRVLLNEYSDSLLASYLTAITSGLSDLSTLITHENYVQSKENAKKGDRDSNMPFPSKYNTKRSHHYRRG